MSGKVSGLSALLRARQVVDGGAMRAQAEQLGISESYLYQLVSGTRNWVSLGVPKLRLVAEYLGIPLLRCLLMAGVLEVSDTYSEPDDFNQRVFAALRLISGSAVASDLGVVEADLQGLELPLQVLLISLYEMANGLKLLPERADLSEIVVEVSSFKNR